MTGSIVEVPPPPHVSISAAPQGSVLVDLTTATSVVAAPVQSVEVEVETPGVAAAIPGLRGEPGEPGQAGPPGPPGVDSGDVATVSYRHYQTTAAAVWTVIHPLGFQPNVTVVDSSGREVWAGTVEYLTENTIRLTFSAAFGGQALLS